MHLFTRHLHMLHLLSLSLSLSLSRSLCAALLLLAQCHNSRQLSEWCLHFVASNYIVFEHQEECSQLTEDNLRYVQQQR